MKILEHRRHSMRLPGGIHLTQEGIDLARRVGDEQLLPNYTRVITSTVPRAIQTAIAMGHAITETTEEFFPKDARVNDAFNRYVPWENVSKLTMLPHIQEYAQQQLTFYQSQLESIDNEQSILMVSHGAIIEFPLLSMIPGFDFTSLRREFSYCEGYRVEYDGSFKNLKLMYVQ